MTQERLKELLHYDPETGIFIWRVSRGGKVIAGSTAGLVQRNGYVYIRVDRRRYLAHRLAWLYIHGKFPSDQIDHINRVRTDNRISNLRAATNAENTQNRSKRSDNTSGVIGVYWDNKRQKWRAQIRLNGHNIFLGSYQTVEEAAAARAAAKATYHTFNPEDNNEKTT